GAREREAEPQDVLEAPGPAAAHGPPAARAPEEGAAGEGERREAGEDGRLGEVAARAHAVRPAPMARLDEAEQVGRVRGGLHDPALEPQLAVNDDVRPGDR